jgi:hypothetical protein
VIARARFFWRLAPVAALLASLIVLAPVAPVFAGSCNGNADKSHSALDVGMTCALDPTESSFQPQLREAGEGDQPAFVAYRWLSVCHSDASAPADSLGTDCGAAMVCPDARERLWRLWGQDERSRAWLPLTTRCFGQPPTAADTPQPKVTPGLVLNALRRVGLPSLDAHTQPEDKTLVNFNTIFYTDAEPFTTNLQLLGRDVDVEATPTEFLWHHGDGTTAATSEPGAPYPAKDITHRYTDAHVTVNPRVDVTYTARFRVNGGAWREIAETITIAGPPGELRVAEATPALSGDYE